MFLRVVIASITRGLAASNNSTSTPFPPRSIETHGRVHVHRCGRESTSRSISAPLPRSLRAEEKRNKERVSRKVERPRSITKRDGNGARQWHGSAASFVKPVPRCAALLKPFHWKPWKIEHERIERDVIWETGITRDRG